MTPAHFFGVTTTSTFQGETSLHCRDCGARTGDGASEAWQWQRYIRTNDTVRQITKARALYPVHCSACSSLFGDLPDLWVCRAASLLSHTDLVLPPLLLHFWSFQRPHYLMACSFIIVSSSSPLGLMFPNKPSYFQDLWFEAFAVHRLCGWKQFYFCWFYTNTCPF